MWFNSPLPRSGTDKPHQGSNLRSIHDEDSAMRVWQKNLSVQANVQRMGEFCNQVQRQFNRLRLRKGGGDGSNVSTFAIQTVKGDYLVCQSYDPASQTSGGDTVFIARNFKLRNSITSAIIDGVIVSYIYNSTVERVATQGDTLETQVIVPRYLIADADAGFSGDIILAVSTDTGITTETADEKVAVLWQDLNIDGRAWAQK